MSPLAPLFWKIGQDCFRLFFQHLGHLSRKVPIPKLPERHELEDTIEMQQPLLVEGLNEIVQLKNEKNIIETNKKKIEEKNKCFTYNITQRKLKKSDLPAGIHVTNCLNCYLTCHFDCKIPRNENKNDCVAMDEETGHCKECFEKCHWTSHANTPFIYEYIEETVTRSYSEKEDRYRRTAGEEMTVSKVINRMDEHLKDLEKLIQQKMDEIRANINLLRRISKRQDTMTLHDQIDLLIQGEEKKKQPDFEKRVVVLKELRNM